MTRLPRALVLLLGLSAMLLLPVPAQAQPPQQPEKGARPAVRRARMMIRPGAAGGSMLGLLRLEQVQKELELVDEQKEKLKAIGEQMRTQMRDLYAGIRDLAPEERRAKMAELREKTKDQAEQIRNKVQKILLPNQRERLKQIQLQLQGVGALGNKEVIEALNITEEQKDKLKSIRDKIREKRQALFGGLRNLGPDQRRKKMEEMRNMAPEERQKKMAQIREKAKQLQEEAVQQALGVLTSEQRETLDKMKGEKFELDRSKLPGLNLRRKRGGAELPTRQGPPQAEPAKK